jgi:hypothetical protein
VNFIKMVSCQLFSCRAERSGCGAGTSRVGLGFLNDLRWLLADIDGFATLGIACSKALRISWLIKPSEISFMQ